MADVSDGILLRGLRRGEEFADRIEKHRDLPVVLLDLAGESAIGREHLAELHERAHDGDVDLRGAFSAQHAGKHRHALLGENVWRKFRMPAPRGGL